MEINITAIIMTAIICTAVVFICYFGNRKGDKR